jgi:hypothetical protein
MKFTVDSKKLKPLIANLAFGLCTVVCGLQPAQAEGSRDLYPSGATGNRANLEWQIGQKYGPVAPVNNSLLRRTLLQVYANKDEYILLGSSAVGVDSGDILIYGKKTGPIGDETLSDEKFKCSTQRTTTGNTNQGKITSRNQELAGPNTITNATNATPGTITDAYTPCYYQAPANGIYYVVIYGPDGNTNSVSAEITADVSLSDTKNFTLY